MLSQASQSIRDPLQRGKHIMLLQYGIQCLEDGERVTDAELLAEVMEVSEELESAVDPKKVEALKQEYKRKVAVDTKELSNHFSREDLEGVRRSLQVLRMHSRVLQRLLEWSETPS
eukprot:GHVS01034165.1.p3 GENE.GHVS01034165.1~~GHVS01034165.1.p3  ORF type:complete len:116 (+),score=8.73 GHVS01034165.1:706-1053(+)